MPVLADDIGRLGFGGWLQIAGLTIASGLLSLFLTYLLSRISDRLGLMAHPRGDRWHKRATPDTGGIAVVATSAALYLLVFPRHNTAIAMGALAVALLGFIDDRLRLRPILKLAGQLLVTITVVGSVSIFPLTPYYYFNLVFGLVWIMGLTNAFNLIDNMDGLCAGAAAIICLFRFWFLVSNGYWIDAQVFAVLAAALAGFLVFNFHPARIFLGDCGSMFIGFGLAALTITGPLPHTRVVLAGLFYPVLSFVYPIFDTTFVVVLRWLSGKSVLQGGMDHSSHLLTSFGIGERQVVFLLWALQIGGSLAGLLSHHMPNAIAAVTALLVILATAAVILIARSVQPVKRAGRSA
jgi:UDP-GlcNAc:undecaprenyl-phosphate GlcNAc-1-phosphate transferase